MVNSIDRAKIEPFIALATTNNGVEFLIDTITSK